MASWNRPELKSGVDLQLQSAFNEGNWNVVIRLAEKRAKASNDFYYEAVKISAESQSDVPAEKAAAILAIEKYLADGTVIKDVDAIDLLEWSVWSVASEREVAPLLGPLRVRLVKALPKDRDAATRCLESCLAHWDLVSAQQIAAMLDRSFSSIRKYMFWSIAMTYLLAVDEQCPPEKKALYGTLALKQIQRVAQTTEQAADAEKPPDRGIQTEEEILLLYRIYETHGSEAEWHSLMESPVLSPVKQFEMGRKEPFLRALGYFESKNSLETVVELCTRCLAGPDEQGDANFLASDWDVWKRFISAAAMVKEETPHVCLDVPALIQAQSSAKNCKTLYKRVLSMARVEASFQLGPPPYTGIGSYQPTQRLLELSLYIDSQCPNPACFDDIRGFIERLESSELAFLVAEYLPKLLNRYQDDPVRASIIAGLAYKIRYFVSTCFRSFKMAIDVGSSGWYCAICSTKASQAFCSRCLTEVAASATKLYCALSNTDESVMSIHNTLLAELAILIATCLIKISRLNQPGVGPKPSPVYDTQPGLLLQAAFILEHQLRKRKDVQITMLLFRLHLILGCISRARALWDSLNVKRTTIDSLAPLFCDRIASVAPALTLAVGKKPGQTVITTIKSHYASNLKLRMQRRFIDAMEEQCYSSVLDMPKYHNAMRRSGTMLMGLIEEIHAARLLGSKTEDMLDNQMIAEILDQTPIGELIDYGAIPNLECSHAIPIQQLLQLGPGPSNQRSHLALLGDEFMTLLTFKSPSTLKLGTGQAAILDHTYVLETADRLERSFNKFLSARRLGLTPQERAYYQLLSFICRLLPLAMATTRAQTPSEILPRLVSGILGCLSTLHSLSLSLPADSSETQALLMLSAPHGLCYLHDGATAIHLAVTHIQIFNDRERERDKSGQALLHKEVTTQIGVLDTAAKKELELGRARIQLLKGEVVQMGFRERVVAWAFGDGKSGDLPIGGNGDLGKLPGMIRKEIGDELNEIAAQMVGSWTENVKGWEQVQWL